MKMFNTIKKKIQSILSRDNIYICKYDTKMANDIIVTSFAEDSVPMNASGAIWQIKDGKS